MSPAVVAYRNARREGLSDHPAFLRALPLWQAERPGLEGEALSLELYRAICAAIDPDPKTFWGR